MIHRNTYINSPKSLRSTFEARNRPGLFFAGQMSGVEGYVESAASGLLCGIAAAARARGQEPASFPTETAIGALGRYISQSDPAHYQPTNIAFGLFPDLAKPVRDKQRRRRALSDRALASLAGFIERGFADTESAEPARV
jgi:methylenetetrahydrofolate--tRNA-(uracil-5-)-methyltransferase